MHFAKNPSVPSGPSLALLKRRKERHPKYGSSHLRSASDFSSKEAKAPPQSHDLGSNSTAEERKREARRDWRWNGPPKIYVEIKTNLQGKVGHPEPGQDAATKKG